MSRMMEKDRGERPQEPASGDLPFYPSATPVNWTTADESVRETVIDPIVPPGRLCTCGEPIAPSGTICATCREGRSRTTGARSRRAIRIVSGACAVGLLLAALYYALRPRDHTSELSGSWRGRPPETPWVMEMSVVEDSETLTALVSYDLGGGIHDREQFSVEPDGPRRYVFRTVKWERITGPPSGDDNGCTGTFEATISADGNVLHGSMTDDCGRNHQWYLRRVHSVER